jgi:signal transduction histidine kinase/CheY-like chemotaxis protein/HPt (histidine-containing phosphotransfer) domain-containing protein
MKKNPVQLKIGLLMILAVILLSATGYLSYRNISSIVSSIRFDVNPEMRLLSIRDISMDLEKAENCIRIYTITDDSSDLKPYFKIISGINQKSIRLRNECKNDSLLLKQTDTIRKLIKQNIIIWDELLNLTRNDKVVQDLKHLSDSLNTASANALKPDLNVFKRVLIRKSKNPNSELELINNLNKIEQQDRITKEKMISREAQLAFTGNQIKEKFYDLITKMENEVTEHINNNADQASLLAGKTYRWLTMFSLSGTLLAIIVMFIIARFVRKTQAYQVALENSKDEAEKLSRTKELFMANMSHEIRTPVTAISGFTEQLLHEPFDEYTTNTLKIIKSSSDHLADIINDILDFSKLQNDKLILEKVHFRIKKISEDVFVLFEKQARQNNTSLSYSLSPDTPPVLLGDPYRLKQIMINLISNSVKFTSNGKVHFSVKSIEKKPGEIELILEFTDTGIGIEESKLDFIFEDFTQAEMSTTRKYGGTGLGLSIVKKLVELHNGRIECRSRKNEGTQITCFLPFMTGDEKLVKSESGTLLSIPDELKRYKILIVDDEEYNRLLFKTILNRWNVKYSEAVNGMEAIEMVKNNHFDLLFMDARMPGIDGLKATQFIREELQIPASQMPVICISAATLNEDREKYEKAGMNAFLEKPFTEEMLLKTILSVMKEAPKTSSATELKEIKNNDETGNKINLVNLLHIAGGDKQFIKHMLITFLDTTAKGLQEMNEAVLSENWNTVSELAHRMIPPCRHIGASDLCSLLRKIEDIIRVSPEKELVESLSRESLKEFDTIKSLVDVHIAEIS